MSREMIMDFMKTLADGELEATEEILRILDLKNCSAGFTVIGEGAFIDKEGNLAIEISKTYRFAVEDDVISQIKKGMLH